MTHYTYAQLEQLWINAGGAKDLAPVMAAIALAESGGNDQATNPTDNNGTQTSWGLWQISNGTHNWPGSANPLNGPNNAAYAVAKYKSQGLAAWGTYDSGAYRAFLNPGTTPDPNVPGGGAGGGGTSLASLASDPSCAWSLPSIGPVGGGCIVHKPTLRHAAGGALMVAGGLIALPGVLVLVAFSFKASGAQRAVAQTAQVLPGPYGRAARQVTGKGRGGATRARAPQRHTRPGQQLSQAEVRQARANRAKLDREHRKEDKAADEAKKEYAPRHGKNPPKRKPAARRPVRAA